jgi:hypothetical protein
MSIRAVVAALQPMAMIIICIVNITNRIETTFDRHDYDLWQLEDLLESR